MIRWNLEEEDGQFVVSWGRKRVPFPTRELAKDFIQKNRSPGDQAFTVDEDGYRTPLIRRRWRKRM